MCEIRQVLRAGTRQGSITRRENFELCISSQSRLRRNKVTSSVLGALRIILDALVRTF